MSKERAFLIFLGDADDQNRLNKINEMRMLIYSCGFLDGGETIYSLNNIDSKYYLSKGRLENLKKMIADIEIESGKISYLVFSKDLSSNQFNGLSSYFSGYTVIDRSGIILNIFKNIARTKEAKLQVEIARLKRLLPTLSGSSTGLDQQSGGMRNKGSGEKELELKKREIKTAITRMSKELEEIWETKKTQKRGREKNQVPLVCLIGYSNAGKSNLLNHLILLTGGKEDKLVESDNRYFTSLDTISRRINLGKGKEFILTDTVGFISDLSKELIPAFHSTLQEIAYSDLVLIVIDSSDLNYFEQVETTIGVLNAVAGDLIEFRFVLNKIDKVDQETIDRLQKRFSNSAILTSREDKQSLRNLLNQIDKIVFSDYQEYDLFVSYQDLLILNYFKSQYVTYNHLETEEGVYFTICTDKRNLDDFSHYLINY